MFEYKGFRVLPPNPTVALSTSTAVPNQTVSVGDAAAATTYWWLATLSTLEGSLGTGAGPAPTVAVTIVKANNQSVPAASTASVSSATYSGGVFTPPVLSGGFTVPSTVSGPVTVHVALSAPLDGIPLTITATAPIFVNNPPTTSVLIPSNGASETGNKILDAAASDYGTLTKVEFHLTGGALNNALIATASPTIYGWLASWNSTTVPNGTYTVQSVAFDAGGLSTASVGVTIHVNNPLPTTSMLIPSTNASVTGTQLLDASASGGEPVQKVVFELTGGTLANTVIADRDADLLRMARQLELHHRSQRDLQPAKRRLVCQRRQWHQRAALGHGGELAAHGDGGRRAPGRESRRTWTGCRARVAWFGGHLDRNTTAQGTFTRRPRQESNLRPLD